MYIAHCDCVFSSLVSTPSSKQSGSKDEHAYEYVDLSPQAVPSADTQVNVAYGQVESSPAPDDGEYVITTISPQTVPSIDTQENVAYGQVESCPALGMEAASTEMVEQTNV